MKEFRTKDVRERDRLAERKIIPTRVEDDEFIYELEEDVPVDDILRELNSVDAEESKDEDVVPEKEEDQEKPAPKKSDQNKAVPKKKTSTKAKKNK